MPVLDITLAQGTESEERVRGWLLELTRQHDLERWLVCRQVVIDAEATVNQARVRDGQPEILLWTGFRGSVGLLSLFLHEQLHVHLAQRPQGLNAAVEDLRLHYPRVPVGGGEGARSARSTYEHLLLCRLEQDALAQLLDAGLLARLKPSGYRFIYREVDRNADFLRALLRRHGLTVA